MQTIDKKLRFFKNGFSLLEFILVVAVLAIISGLLIPNGLNFYRKQLTKETRSDFVDALKRAQLLSKYQKNDSSFGVYFDDSGSYTLFQGSTYAGRTESEDEVFSLIEGMTVSASSSEIIFTKKTGIPNFEGTISVIFGSVTEDISISSSGVISEE